MRTLVVLPSYNEITNIQSLVESLFAVRDGLDVCIVDDNSPDGTARLITDLIETHPTWHRRAHLLLREGKGGRGGAVRDGMAWGIARGGYDTFVEMDCDHSHDPAELPTGLRLLEAGNDVVIGARYPDGQIVGWPTYRRVFSRLANFLARVLLEWSVADYTNGYRIYTPESAKALSANPQQNTGFIYLSESLARLMRSGAKVASFPITFRDRSGGESSADLREVAAALSGLLRIAWWYRVRSR